LDIEESVHHLPDSQPLLKPPKISLELQKLVDSHAANTQNLDQI
jgi:hypothetical protein